MSKKAKSRRKDAYKTLLNGLVTYRTNFIQRKLRLSEKILDNASLQQSIQEKGAKMTVLERATLQMIRDRELSSVDDLKAIAEAVQENQEKSAKFKYTPKKI